VQSILASQSDPSKKADAKEKETEIDANCSPNVIFVVNFDYLSRSN
jgi:hypothetical protein